MFGDVQGCLTFGCGRTNHGIVEQRNHTRFKGHLQRLTECHQWSEITDLLESVQCVYTEGDKKAFFAEFRAVIAGYCPRYDFTRDSVQSRILNCSGDSEREAFKEQEEMRLRGGFERGCLYLFGKDWRDSPEELLGRRFLREVEIFNLSELREDGAQILKDAFDSMSAI